ncbi:hypothetical protein [Paenibacillus alvei]|nr:hypothetical protein [Paenibacillus alvei]
MRNKWIMVVMAFFLIFAVTTPTMMDIADAKRGGSFRSGVQKYKPAPNKSTNNQVNRSDNTNQSKTSSTAPTQNRGFFSGGSLMKGLMIGGLAGMLFGSMFGNLGFMGDILGLMINVMALFLLISLVMMVVKRFRNKRNPSTPSPGRWN